MASRASDPATELCNTLVPLAKTTPMPSERESWSSMVLFQTTASMKRDGGWSKRRMPSANCAVVESLLSWIRYCDGLLGSNTAGNHGTTCMLLPVADEIL